MISVRNRRRKEWVPYMGTAGSPYELTFRYVNWESIGPANAGDGRMK